MRQSAARRERNRGARSEMRSAVRKVRGAAAGGDAKTAQEALASAIETIDRSAKKGVVHRNAAARTKSRLVKAVNRAAK